MRATKIKGAVVCPLCSEVIDPEEDGVPEAETTWLCPDCEVVTTSDGFIDQKTCSHEPPEVVSEQCPSCMIWVDPQEFVERKQCPKCYEWFDPEDLDFDETEAFKCGECDTIYEDRDEAKECCR